MTDRRGFLGLLGSVTAVVGRASGQRVNTAITVNARATVLYQQPDGRNNLLRVTVTGLEAPAARRASPAVEAPRWAAPPCSRPGTETS